MSSARAAFIASLRPRGAAGTSVQQVTCQKCLQKGHWTYQCKNEARYVTRPSRTQQLANPRLKPALSSDTFEEKPVETYAWGKGRSDCAFRYLSSLFLFTIAL